MSDVPVNRGELRASDADREQIAAQLRDAHVDGRLRQDELDSRLTSAFEAQTYGELEPLVRDLPVSAARPAEPAPSESTDLAPDPDEEPASKRRKPDAMKVVWATWFAAVMINMVVWVLVSVTSFELIYFWPVWVAGPWGAVLLSIEIIRRIARD